MKKILNKLILFLGIFFIFSYIFQIFIFSAIRRIHIGDFGVLNAIDSGTINTEMLICGSSRGYDHYNPEILGELTGYSCYNISLNGSRLEIQVPVLKWYLDKNRPPHFIIQNIDIFAGEFDPVIFMPYRFVPYLRDKSLFQGLKVLDNRWWLHKYIPCTNLIYFNKDIQAKLIKELYSSYRNVGDYLIKGYHPTKLYFNDKYEKEYLKKYAHGIRYTISQIYKTYLNELIDLCRKYNIQLILVLSPEYEKIISLEINRQEIIDFYVSLSQKNDLWFLDFAQSEICLNRDFFYNFTHMNAEGADRFSRDLAIELRNKLSAK